MNKSNSDNIYLIGFSGSGKSTVGPALAKNINAMFYDIDYEIIKKTKKEINDIFLNDGEAYFRKLESKILKIVTNKKDRHKVIAVGGGAFQNKSNRKFIFENGVSIYLSCSQRELYRRLAHKTDRPLLTAASKKVKLNNKSSELKSKIKKLLEKRIDNYLQADIIVSTTAKTQPEIIKDIKKKLSKYAGY